MTRSSSNTQPLPLYRDIIKHAAHVAWHDRQYWPLALFAGLLATAGAYDIAWKIVTSITEQGQFIGFTQSISPLFPHLVTTGRSSMDFAVSLIGGLESLLFLVLIVFGFCIVSCIAQGGLVFALGAKRKGSTPTLREAWHVGGQAFWPIASLNIMAFVVTWVLRFLAALPLMFALESTTTTTYLIYLVSFGILVPLSFFIAILHIFALNSMVLQGSSLPDGLWRSYQLIKKNWVVIFETAIMQTLVSMGVWFVCVLAALLLLIPAFVTLLAAGIIHSGILFAFAFTVSAIFFVGGLLLAAAFTIQLQYATWTSLFRRLGEGGVLPKIHRVLRTLFGTHNVPSA